MISRNTLFWIALVGFVIALGFAYSYAAESCQEKCYRIHGQTPAGDRCAAAC